MAEADFDRTPNLLTTFNHAALGDAIGWVNRLDEIDVPALVVHGTEDPVLPYAHAVALEAALPRASLLTLEGTGHELHQADWPAILDAVEHHTAPRRRDPQSMQANAPPTASARSSGAPGARAPVTEGDRGAGEELGSILVRDLRPEEIPEAVAVLARGMRDNPLHVAAYPAAYDRPATSTALAPSVAPPVASALPSHLREPCQVTCARHDDCY